MNGIYIPGMEMPTSCYGNCPFFTQILPGEDHGLVNYCCLENWKQPRTPMPFSVEEAKHGRQDFCPLVPVPPHGRLIDADALKVSLVFSEKTAEWTVPALRAGLMVIDEMPTIIEAVEVSE